MRLGMTLPTMMPDLGRERLLAWARGIDAGPFTTLAVGERITFPNLELMVAMSAAAAVTSRVELMPTVVVLPLHSAAVMAKQVATLDVLSGGRVTLGVGTGGREEDYRAAGAAFDHRLTRMRAQVATMRRLWAGEPPEEGMAPVGPAPSRGAALPVLIGALSHDSIRKAARWADGVCGFSMGPDGDEVAAAFEVARSAWREHGRPVPRLVTSAWYSIAPDGRERMDAYVGRYLGIFGERAARGLAKRCLATSPDALRGAIARMRDAGADDFLLVPTTSDPGELDRVTDLVG